jgi:thymidylate synthase (FAD)
MHEVKPKAELIEYGSHLGNISRIYAGYRRCYSASDNAEVNALPSDMEAFIRKMLKAEHAHESPLEHASLTWHLTCSRACSHQLVRHRIASYSQQSQRYVRMNDLPVIVPPSASDLFCKDYFMGGVREAEKRYSDLIEGGVSAEDARYLLPHCVATQIVVTMNFRSLLHFFNERCCNRAQWEIRDIANQMLEQCKDLYPCVFENAGPHCMKLKHCPEAKPCGTRPWKENHE